MSAVRLRREKEPPIKFSRSDVDIGELERALLKHAQLPKNSPKPKKSLRCEHCGKQAALDARLGGTDWFKCKCGMQFFDNGDDTARAKMSSTCARAPENAAREMPMAKKTSTVSANAEAELAAGNASHAKKKPKETKAERPSERAMRLASAALKKPTDTTAASAAQETAMAKKKAKTKKKGKAAVKKAARASGGIGALAKDLLRKKLDTEEVIAGVKEKFPDSKINTAAVAWYRARL